MIGCACGHALGGVRYRAYIGELRTTVGSKGLVTNNGEGGGGATKRMGGGGGGTKGFEVVLTQELEVLAILKGRRKKFPPLKRGGGHKRICPVLKG